MQRQHCVWAVGALVMTGVLLTAGCHSGPTIPEGKVYEVRYLPRVAITIDGNLDDAGWADAVELTDFVSPWVPGPVATTVFRACCDDKQLYFAFRVKDDNVVVQEGEDEEAVAEGDRAELFFAADARLKEYYCLEMDPRGRVLDYAACYYRQLDSHWDWPGLVVAAAIMEGGYNVEGSLPLASLAKLGVGDLLAGEPLWVGVFRGQFSRLANGTLNREWISWVRPEAQEPDFHIPSALGAFEMRTGPK